MLPAWSRLPVFALVVTLLFSAALECRAQQPALPEIPNKPILSADTPVQLRLTANLYTKDAKPGFPLKFAVVRDVTVDRRVVIAMGSMVQGTVQKVEPSGKGPAQVLISLSPTQTIFGETVRLGTLQTTMGKSPSDRPGLRDVGGIVSFDPEVVPALPVIVPVLAVMSLFPGKKVLLHENLQEVVHVAENVVLDSAKFAAQPQVPELLERLHSLSLIFSSAEYLRQTGQLDDAIGECQRALPLQPDLHWRLAELFREKGDYPRAIAEYRAAVQFDPNIQDVRINLIGALEAVGDFDAAIAESRAAVRLWPDKPYLHYLLGRALVKSNDPDAAIPELQSALQSTKNHLSPANCSLGRALELKGDLRAAFAQYRTAYRAHLRDDDKCLASYERLKLQLHH